MTIRAGQGGENSAALVRLTTALRPPDPLPTEVAAQRLGAGAVEQLTGRS